MAGRVRAILGRLSLLDENERKDAIAQRVVLAGLRKAERVVVEEVTAMGVPIDLEQNEVLKSYFAQAEARGKAEGRADLLLKQLHRRFGPLADPLRQRGLAADARQVDAWAEAIFDADSPHQLLGPPPR